MACTILITPAMPPAAWACPLAVLAERTAAPLKALLGVEVSVGLVAQAADRLAETLEDAGLRCPRRLARLSGA